MWEGRRRSAAITARADVTLIFTLISVNGAAKAPRRNGSSRLRKGDLRGFWAVD